MLGTVVAVLFSTAFMQVVAPSAGREHTRKEERIGLGFVFSAPATRKGREVVLPSPLAEDADPDSVPVLVLTGL